MKRSHNVMDSGHVISKWGKNWLSKLHKGHLSRSDKPARNKLALSVNVELSIWVFITMGDNCLETNQ